LLYRGLYLYARMLGPFYRIVIRDKDENGRVMAVSSGFTVPAMGLMHCDSLEIFTRGSASMLERLTVSLDIFSYGSQHLLLAPEASAWASSGIRLDHTAVGVHGVLNSCCNLIAT
jgi:hypothetical protein